MPGGFGTLDEYFEAVTLIQTKKINQIPVIIFDKQFHKDLLEHIEIMKTNGTISPDDSKLFLITDSVDEAIAYIRVHSIEQFNLKAEKKYKPLKWLFEKKYYYNPE